MAKSVKRKTSPRAKRAKTTVSWGETLKKALADKPGGGKGPAQPKPRDSGTFKVKKNSF